MHIEQPAFGDALGMVEQSVGLGADNPTVFVGLHRQFVVVEVGRHDVVFPTREEHRRTRVALATGAATQLVVQALGVMASGADDVQPPELGNPVMVGFVGSAEPDVGATAGHLSRHGDHTELAGLGDHLEPLRRRFSR